MKPYRVNVIALLLVLTSCSSPTVVPPTATPPLPTATATVVPSETPTLTPSPTATSTEVPATATPTPTPYSGRWPIIAHFNLPESANSAEKQGVYLVDGSSGKLKPNQLLSFPTVLFNQPLLKFSTDGRYLLVAPRYLMNDPAHLNKSLDIIDISSGEVRSLAIIDPKVEVLKIAWSPDGQWVMVMYYHFGRSDNQIDLYRVSDGMKLWACSQVFVSWLPDSSGILTESNQYYHYDIGSRQLTPYLARPSYGSMGLFKLLPEIDSAVMRSKDELFLLSKVSRFAAPYGWSRSMVNEEAVLIGPAPDRGGYQPAGIGLSPSGKWLLVGGRPHLEDYFTDLIALDGSVPIRTFPGIVPVAWSPDETAFLGIRLKDVPFRGVGNYSGTPHELVYTIQPLDEGLDPITLYTVPSTCGLMPTLAELGFAQSRAMLDCAFSPLYQDVTWK